MARSTDKFDSNQLDSTIPGLKGKVPTIDELMRSPQPPPWWRSLPPPTTPDPFGPVPIIPPPPPPRFVPPDNLTAAGGLAERIAALKVGLLTPARNPLPLDEIFANGAPSIPFLPLASQRAPRGLPAMLADVGAFDPSNPEAPPSGGLPGLIREYLRNH